MDISVIISTYNRCDLLGRAISSILAQEADTPPFELIVVNNNCTDDTSKVIDSFVSRDARVRTVFEKRQGLSYGRNAGIAAAQGQFIIFTDDDVVVTPNWVRKFHEAFLQYPDAAFFGGKVLPIWELEPESWLDALSPPLALQDMGNQPVKVTFEVQRCLIGACLGIRRSTFDKVGLFDPATQRVGDSIGSTEDHDWELSVWETGAYGLYVPDIVCAAEISANRMTKSYHRRWHFGHGKFSAISQRSEYAGGRFQVLDVPAFMYRQIVQYAFRTVIARLRGREKEAFNYETFVHFYSGFIRQRWRSALSGRGRQSTALPDSR